MSFLIGVIIFVLQVLSFALLVYCVLSFVMPQSTVMDKARPIVEPILSPIRVFLCRLFPKLESMALDFSPLVAWLAIDIVIWLLSLLRSIF
ncbi:MAG: YggT family protein [Eubacteriales bacterium]|nr:YggT family protein [Eubacteriales bacterium]